jgi:uncharacterized protein (DUF885 family)
MGETGQSGAFDAAVAAFLREYFEAEPVSASFYGLTEWDAQLPDFTAAGFADREAATRRWLQRFTTEFGAAPAAATGSAAQSGADPDATLSHDQKVDLALLRAHLGQQVATADFAHWRRYPTTYLENGVFELFMHGTRAEAEATAAAVERLRQVPAALAAGRDNLDPALVDAELLRQWALPNTAAQAAFMREGLEVFTQDPAHGAALRTAGNEAAEAYDEFGVYLGELAERATGSFVFGEANYDAVLGVGEGFDFDVRTLREMGRAQVASLDAQMSELADIIAGTTNWRAVVDRLRDDHPGSMEEMLQSYRDETERARTFVRTSGLMSIPEGEELAVEPAPLFLRSAAPVASYFPPPFFGPPSRGTFNVPFTPDDATPEERDARLRSNAYFEIPGVTAHEAYPGHHLHFAAAQGTSALRQVLQSTYMVEGWGLYVENMVGRHGFYLTPEVKLGQLSMRLFRAGRIVVDTSLHLGEMDIEEATTFMAERCGFPVPTAFREVLRYCSYPTQASSYLTGALEIERMAQVWTESGRGPLSAFHDALTTSGKLPLGVAPQAIGLAPNAAAEGSAGGSFSRFFSA